jgi:hypothetical protein
MKNASILPPGRRPWLACRWAEEAESLPQSRFKKRVLGKMWNQPLGEARTAAFSGAKKNKKNFRNFS